MRALWVVTIFGVLSLWSCTNSNEEPETGKKSDTTISVVDSSRFQPKKVEYDSFGFPYDSSMVSDYKVKRNESLYAILDRFDFSPQQIYSITNKAKKIFDVRSLKPGQNYRVYASADPTRPISRLVWQPRPVDYVVFDWEDSLNIYQKQKKIEVRRVTESAVINSSLYEAMADNNMDPMLAYKLSEIYAWQIDFFGLRKGDHFKLLYEKKFVDEEYYELGEILAVSFIHRGQMYNAYRFEGEEVEGYFDEEGRSVQKALLKAPFSYSQRISSGFSHSRFHPVLKRRMPHYGVDYAAPYGTPVLSVGDGTVTEARYRGANGNIVKIRHNSTYETAYLHLKGFARGIRSGAHVKQGQVIGYVGNTGRVTGTHLDYRIYKNDRPVNPLRIELPASRSVPEQARDHFNQVRDSLQKRLDQLPGQAEPVLTKN